MLVCVFGFTVVFKLGAKKNVISQIKHVCFCLIGDMLHCGYPKRRTLSTFHPHDSSVVLPDLHLTLLLLAESHPKILSVRGLTPLPCSTVGSGTFWKSPQLACCTTNLLPLWWSGVQRSGVTKGRRVSQAINSGAGAGVAKSLAPQCCGHWVNRISGLEVSLTQLNANTGACLYTVAKARNGSRILGLHLVTVSIHTEKTK